MLERIKKFYEENRFEIVVVGGLVLLVAGTALITKKSSDGSESHNRLKSITYFLY